jgi:hypothetical protein
MNKQGKINWAMVALVLCAVVIAGSMAYSTFGSEQTIIGEDGQPIVTNTACNGDDPSVSVIATNALEQDTLVTVGATYRVNGKTLGATYSNPAKGDKVQILVNASNYIDTQISQFTVECGPNNKNVDIYATAAPTLTILKDSTTLTDAATGGANNLTALGAGGSQSFTLRVKGADLKSTSDLIYTVELGSVQNVSNVIMYNAAGAKLEKVTNPTFYSDTLTSPYVVSFKIPATTGSVELDYKIDVTAKSAKTVTGAVYTQVYGAQDAVDKDGTFVKNVIENSNGDTKYEFTADYDFFINA